MLQASNERTDKIKKFYKSLEGLPVVFFNNKASGEIKKNGLRYNFNISDGYISQEIHVEYLDGDKLVNFLKMSDNKLWILKMKLSRGARR